MSSSKKSAGRPASVSYGADAAPALPALYDEARGRQLEHVRMYAANEVQRAVDLLTAAREVFPKVSEGVPAFEVMTCALEALECLVAELEANAAFRRPVAVDGVDHAA
jgi:hypothetical protein